MEQTQSQQKAIPSFIKDTLNNRPVIAILGQINKNDKTGQSYLAASYVKYLESSGARVIPVPVGVSDEKIEEIFHGVNGVLFPGGGVKWDVSVQGYYKHALKFVELARAANDKGDYFPVWGTCLGFQALHVIVAGGRSEILSSGFASEDISIPLNFKDDPKKTRMFEEMSDELLKSLGDEPVTYNHHQAGVTPDTYQKENVLSNFFDVISTNEDKDGRTFISTVEGKKYPFYGTQWHPEKNNLEFKSNLHINHTPKAVRISQYMSDFFVNEAKKSHHQFSSEEKLQDLLIYNYSPIYTGKGDDEYKNFAQIYKFDPVL